MLLENSERFQKEYREFSEEIAKISDERVKNETKDLLNRLVAAVRDIDRRHTDMFMTRTKLPSSIDDAKNNVVDIRKKIQSRLQECRRAGFIKS
jgi:uncharacterized coiled-coil DUF342 family protein